MIYHETKFILHHFKTFTICISFPRHHISLEAQHSPSPIVTTLFLLLLNNFTKRETLPMPTIMLMLLYMQKRNVWQWATVLCRIILLFDGLKCPLSLLAKNVCVCMCSVCWLAHRHCELPVKNVKCSI